MANNIPKPPKENKEDGSNSPSQRSSLWKRLGRRGNKSLPLNTFQQLKPSGSIPSKSTKELYDIPLEADHGDARSLTSKRAQRMNNNSNNNNNNIKNNTSSKGVGLMMRKLKYSFRKNSAHSDQNQSQQDRDRKNNASMLTDHERNPLPLQRHPDPNSPVYSADSFVTVEVGSNIIREISIAIVHTTFVLSYFLLLLTNISFHFVNRIVNCDIYPIQSNLEGKKDSFESDEIVLDRKDRQRIYQKQQIKERDGFCRRVDTYDGQVIVVDNKPTYEIGNYLGGGVAGVVYEGHRLRPMEEYPVRTGIAQKDQQNITEAKKKIDKNVASIVNDGGDGEFLWGSSACGACGTVDDVDNVPIILAGEQVKSRDLAKAPPLLGGEEEEAMAIEATMSYDETGGVMLDAQDTPSRSKHYTKAAAVPLKLRANSKKPLQHGLSDESVAIKILNPVGYRILQNDSLKDCVVVKTGQSMDRDMQNGVKPMQEKHVWWLVNPNSRNLITLQRYNGKDENSTVPKGLQIDRGSTKKGLRLSLIAAYIDPRNEDLRELTLTRCIEIWGHIPFNATDTEFDDMMTAIERVNAGHPPPAFPVFDDVPGRVGTDKTDPSDSSSDNDESLSPVVFGKART